jgi:hypothetical protein
MPRSGGQSIVCLRPLAKGTTPLGPDALQLQDGNPVPSKKPRSVRGCSQRAAGGPWAILRSHFVHRYDGRRLLTWGPTP